jgi:hypothetical protein
LPVTYAAVASALWGAENSKKYNPVESGNLMRQNLAQIRSRLADELTSKSVYLIPNRSHLEDTEGFGEAVATAFPNAVFDIVEAGKCLTFSRATACVMHLMRVLEVGLFALAARLDIDAKSDNWNSILDLMEKEIRSRTKKTHGEDWKNIDEPFFTEAATHFRFLKNG